MNSENIYVTSQQQQVAIVELFVEDYVDERKKLVDDIHDFSSLSLPAEDFAKVYASCSQCRKDIFNYEINVELGEHYYHKECYKCKCCVESFPLDEAHYVANLMPIQDSCGFLFCTNDFIR